MYGGIETFLWEWIRSADREHYNFTWYIPGKILDIDFIERFRQQGVHIVEGGRLYGSTASIITRGEAWIGLVNDIRRLMKKQKYDIVHINAGSPMAHMLCLMGAMSCKRRIVHAHNSYIDVKGIVALKLSIGRMIVAGCATQYAACSRKAANFMLGERYATRAHVIPNCIDTKKFCFSRKIREEYRGKLGIQDQLLVGHIGRFVTQKNHERLIDIFRCLLEHNPNIRLLLLGEGILKKHIEALSVQYALADKVIFAGITDEVEKYMCAMDVFVLPSFYEGFPLVGVEAQANGLPCVFSNAIANEIKLDDSAVFCSLNESSEKWAQTILSLSSVTNEKREDAYEIVKAKGYDISSMSAYIEMLYAGNPCDPSAWGDLHRGRLSEN